MMIMAYMTQVVIARVLGVRKRTLSVQSLAAIDLDCRADQLVLLMSLLVMYSELMKSVYRHGINWKGRNMARPWLASTQCNLFTFGELLTGNTLWRCLL